jgi:hypothetical protein
VGSELLHSDRRRDRHDEDFRNFAKAPKKIQKLNINFIYFYSTSLKMFNELSTDINKLRKSYEPT